MATVTVDGQDIEIGDDERLNGIQVAQRAGVEIPRYCWHPGLSVVASCRMCLVETGQHNAETGEVSMVPKLVPACQTQARDGSIFITESEKVLNVRAMVEEDLLLNHPIDCPTCDKAGECSLQDYHFEHGRDERRADINLFHSRRRPVGETVTLFVDRCVMCTRCVRFTREVTGTNELMIVGRGNTEEIDVFPGYPLDNKMSGNVVDLCPVGALVDTDFLFQQRVWFMESHDGVCAGCSTGCSIKIEENQDHVYRLKPRENPAINQWWMCDDGRYGFHHVHDENRLVGPNRRADDETEGVEWDAVAGEIDASLRKVNTIAAVLSPHLTVEAAYLLAKYLRSLDPQAVLALGPVPTDGEDESFPGGFTIRAEKCPNRRGVEEVIAHFTGRVTTFDQLLKGFEKKKPDALWVTGGYTKPWIDEATTETLREVDLLIAQDLFTSPLYEQADYQLPSAAFAEQEGSYVNVADRLQSFAWAIRSPGGVRIEGSVYWQLLGMSGLFKARRVLDEVAAEIGFFAEAAGEVPSLGVDLKLNRLADATSNAEKALT
jgi:NADH-quinone oxidoreductase subunit G